MIEKAWPLYGLKIETERLHLKMMSLDEVACLASVSRGNILSSPGIMLPWVSLSSPEYEINFFQHHLKAIANWNISKWRLNLGVFLKNEIYPIGVVGIYSENFLETKTVRSNSWLLLKYQGRGIGKEMRRGSLELAFDFLHADRARSTIHPDNLASQKVSKSLGYIEDGTKEVEGYKGGIGIRFLLSREDWTKDSNVSITGFSSCDQLFFR